MNCKERGFHPMSADDNFLKLNEQLQTLISDPITNRMLGLEIQLKLLDLLCSMENEINGIKMSINEMKKNSKTQKLLREERISIGTKITSLNEDIIFIKEDMKRVRELGDSIAFLYFDKHDIKHLCWKQSAGFIGGKEGLEKELKTLKKIYEFGSYGILNDLTNSIKYGDITTEKDGKPILIEVKSSGNINPRIERQRKDIEQAMSIIKLDEIDDFMGGSKKFKRIYTSIPEENHLDDLRELISTAFLHGVAYGIVEEGLLYIVHYKSNDFINGFSLMKEKIIDPYIFYINGMKDVRENYTPFSIIFSDEISLMEFYAGNLIISVVVDKYILSNLMEDNGYKLDFENNKVVVTFTKDNQKHKMEVSSFHFTRLGREFFSIRYFVQGIIDVLNSVN